MTYAELRQDKGYYRAYVTNHTEPCVCAGISALVQTVIGWALNSRVRDLEYSIEEGECHISFHSHSRGAREVWKAFEIGLLQIENGYPDDLRVCIWGYTPENQ